MERIVDPRYLLAFSSQTGRPYHRKCYWENLYVFAYGADRVLVATRVVPFHSPPEALYAAFKGQHGNTLTQHLLPEALQRPHLSVFNDASPVQSFADDISALVPEQSSQLPEELIAKTETRIEEAASRIVTLVVRDFLNIKNIHYIRNSRVYAVGSSKIPPLWR